MAGTVLRQRNFPPQEAKGSAEKVELLTTEFHPTLGKIERWRMSDGSVQRFEG